MKKIISLFLAALLSVAFCTSAFAVSSDDWDEPIALPLDNETSIFPMSESENYPEEQANLPNGVRLIPANAPGTQNDTSLNMLGLQRSEGPSACGTLIDVGEVAAYTLEIDFDISPKVFIAFYRYWTTNDFTIEICSEGSSQPLRTSLDNGNNPYLSRRLVTLSSSEGGIKRYSISITSLLPETGYAFIVSTPETFIDDFSGKESCATVGKNIPTELQRETSSNNFMKGYQALLNGDGEWFHYIADGETYITGEILNWDHLAFTVYDETGKEVYASERGKANFTKQLSSTLYEGYVQVQLNLEPGRDYWVKFYSTSYKQVSDINETYNIWMGLPKISREVVDYASPVCTVSPNVTKTFTFNVSGYPTSMRVDNNTTFYFTGDYKSVDARVTSCQITAPNGYSFSANMGHKDGISKIELDNYLTNPSNVPVNGKWKVTVRASQSIPNLRFRIAGRASAIIGKGGN